MNKIVELREQLNAADEALNENTAAFENAELTESEEALLEEMKSGDGRRIVVVNEENGGKTEVPVDDYLASLDKKVLKIKNDNIKLMSRRVEKNAEDLEHEARAALKNNSRNATITDEELDSVTDEAIEAVKKYFGMDEITSDAVNRLAKLPAEQVLSILPSRFISLFTTISANKIKMKEELLASLAYTVSIGPEMDRLNEDIDHHNKMIDLMMRMNDINVDFAEILSSPESLKEMASRIMENSNEFTKTYTKYVKNPDAINNLYTQKAYTLGKMNDAYRKFHDELTDPVEKAEVAKEIASNDAMIKVYGNILNLTTIRTAVEQIIETGRGKKGSFDMKLIDANAEAALKRFRKMKEAIAVPGYTGHEKGAKEIYLNYQKYFRELFDAYNKVVDTAITNGDTALRRFDISPVVFSKCLLLVLGKISKKLSEQDTLDASVEIVITFDMVCRLGTELFMLERIYNEILPLAELVKQN